MLTPTSKTFKPDNFYFLLPVEKPEIPERIRAVAEQEHMIEKPHCHVSVVVEKSSVRIRAALDQGHKKTIVDLFESLQFGYTLTDTFSLQEKK